MVGQFVPLGRVYLNQKMNIREPWKYGPLAHMGEPTTWPQVIGRVVPRDHPLIVDIEKTDYGEHARIETELGGFPASWGWCPEGSRFSCVYFDCTSGDQENPPDLGIHDDCKGTRPAPRRISIVIYLEAPKVGGGLEIYTERGAQLGREHLRNADENVSTSQFAAFTLSTRPLPDEPPPVQILCFRAGTWHRPQPWEGRRRILVCFQHTGKDKDGNLLTW